MIQLYTGEGKGKTTAAIGQAVRAAGSGWRVLFAQFMKGNDTGELSALELLPLVTICRSSRQFGFYDTLTDEEKRELTAIHNGILDRLLKEAGEQTCDMIILDEITYPVKWKLLDEEKLRRLLQYGAEGKFELVMTGRDPAGFLQDCADYITCMQCVRHPYQKGVAARKGIEY